VMLRSHDYRSVAATVRSVPMKRDEAQSRAYVQP
jgi:hypothetical protein